MTSFPQYELLGQEKPRQIFRQAFDKGTLHHAWILAGQKGSGKSGFAKQTAEFLLDADSATPSKPLLLAGSHPDFRILQRGPKTDKEDRKAREYGIDALEEHELKRNISVAQVRSLQSLLSTQASISRYRVIIIDSIDDLESGGANALLKNLEEPPKDTIFLLISHTPERLLPTIRSRCQILRFEPLAEAQMREALLKLSPKLDEAELCALIAAGEGSPGRALQYTDAGLAELEMMAQKIIATGDKNNQIKAELARKLSLKAAAPRYSAFLSRAPAIMAQHIKSGSKTKSIAMIESWKAANELAAMAIPKALDSQAVIFRLGTLMGSLAEAGSHA